LVKGLTHFVLDSLVVEIDGDGNRRGRCAAAAAATQGDGRGAGVILPRICKGNGCNHITRNLGEGFGPAAASTCDGDKGRFGVTSAAIGNQNSWQRTIIEGLAVVLQLDKHAHVGGINLPIGAVVVGLGDDEAVLTSFKNAGLGAICG